MNFLDPQLCVYALYNPQMNIPAVTPQQLKDAMPVFLATFGQDQLPEDAERLALALRIRCGLANYVLNITDGSLEDRVYTLVAGVPIEVDDREEPVV